MAQRLVKVAKELNVGTTTIVDYLNDNGYEIDNKPTAKVTDDMYNSLLKEFSKSIAIKEKADQLVIGNRPATKQEEPVPPPPPPPPPPVQKEEVPPPPPPPPIEEPIIKEVPVVEDIPVVEAPVPPVKEEVEPVVPTEPAKVEERELPKLKVLGKIDLESTKKRPKKVIKEEPVKQEIVEKPKVVEKPVEPVEEKKSEPIVAETTPTKEVVQKTPEKDKKESNIPAPEEKAPPKENEMVRAETPQLKGLKILGKIDTDKFKKPKKKKKTAGTGTPKDGATPQQGGDAPKKRKRTRKKVPASSQGQGQGQNRNNTSSTAGGGNRTAGGGNRPPGNRTAGGGNRHPGNRTAGGGNRSNNSRGGQRGGNNSSRGGRRNDVKEVSAKEIDDKIKATMARLSGGGKRKRQKMRRENRERLRENQEQREQERTNEKLQLTEFVSVSELASLMDVSVTEVITTCMSLGVIVSINQRLDAEVIELVAGEFDHEVEFIAAEEQEEEEEEIVENAEDLLPRAPIVTVMGHVDHGKTSLLDHIRKANVADGEAGGITQHIGAYEVLVGENNKKITFLDTPGHEAFTAMRARGAKVTDVAVIIISADDNIMPQTKEAISHAQAASVPIVFAINKIDKDGAQPERIKQELASMNFLVEEWGGKYQSQDISAKQGTNIDLLLEKILLEAEMLDLKANPNRQAVGTVVEASLDKGRGYVTKILVQTGTLKIGDSVVAGEHSGKIKAMFNERGKKVKEAGPSSPVLILGLSGAPQAGEKFKVMDSEQDVRQLASKRARIAREQANRASKRISLDEIGRRLALGTFKELNLIVKGDVDGSIEALSDSLIKQSIETVQVNVIHKAVGQIIESDVLLASASDAIIIGFQVRPSLGARKLAEREGVEIKSYSVIYEAIDEIRSAIEGMLEPTKEEKIVGQVEVRETYKISKIGTIAGCHVTDGKLLRSNFIRLVRDGIVVFPTKEGVKGEISSLKRFKDDVKEVKNNMECGITIKNYNDIKVGDVIEAYEIIEVKQTLDKK